MRTTIEKIYRILKYYRKDDSDPSVRITPKHIREWIYQFDTRYQKVILQEVAHIFSKQYCSKAKAKFIIEKQLRKMSAAYGFKSVRVFLDNSQFLDLQAVGSSQKEMLQLTEQVLKAKFNYSISRCGRKSKTYSIYIDDALYTGNRVLRTIQKWYGEQFNKRRTNREAIRKGKTTVVLCFIFAHGHSYRKRVTQLRYSLGSTARNNFGLFTEFSIETDWFQLPNYRLIFPAPILRNKVINAYREKVDNDVSAYVDGQFDIKNQRFFRRVDYEHSEMIFTSAFNRKIVEKQFLLKGIEILKKANVAKENVRALGYTLPSERSFGFGALCFTWRNIANNTPLVFWYSQSSRFIPLFKRRP